MLTLEPSVNMTLERLCRLVSEKPVNSNHRAGHVRKTSNSEQKKAVTSASNMSQHTGDLGERDSQSNKEDDRKYFCKTDRTQSNLVGCRAGSTG